MPSSGRLSQLLRDFWSWWYGELSALWPRRSSDGELDASTWELDVMGDELALHAGSSEALYLIDPNVSEEEIPQGPKAPASPVALRLDPALAIVQPVDLPLAAEENLGQVIAYQMDRETPFTADRVYFDYRVVDRDRAEQLLRTELVVIPRRVLDPVFERLRHWGVPLRAAQIRVDPDGAVYDLLPVEHRVTFSRWPKLLNAALLALALALLATGIALPVLEKQQRLGVLEPQLTAARRDALATNRLRGEIRQLRDRLDFAVDEKRGRVKLLDVMEEITRLLPDDTWLLELEIAGEEVQMRGETPNAAQLVGLLESSKRLRNARFRSPVTQVGAGKERFHLSVELQPEAAS